MHSYCLFIIHQTTRWSKLQISDSFVEVSLFIPINMHWSKKTVSSFTSFFFFFCHDRFLQTSTSSSLRSFSPHFFKVTVPQWKQWVNSKRSSLCSRRLDILWQFSWQEVFVTTHKAGTTLGVSVNWWFSFSKIYCYVLCHSEVYKTVRMTDLKMSRSMTDNLLLAFYSLITVQRQL